MSLDAESENPNTLGWVRNNFKVILLKYANMERKALQTAPIP